MKKFILCLSALFVLTACDPSTPSKCSDPNELKEAIVAGSTDTARFDLNGDGEITIADLNVLVSNENDTTKVDSL